MKKLLFGVFLLAVLSLSACSNENQIKAWGMIDKGALLVDVRTREEFSAGHLPGAKLIPVSQLSARISEFGRDKHRPIVVYCRSGSRSGRAKEFLEANGFTQVFNGGGYSALMSTKADLDKGEV